MARRLAALHVLLCLAEAKQMQRAAAVTKITPDSITAKTATSITFTGAADGDKVEFALDCTKVSTPGSTVAEGVAKITVEDEAEKLSLCLQEAGKNEVVAQNGVALAVVPPTDTGAIIGIAPTTITQGEATTISIKGAGPESKAIFIPAQEDCRQAIPTVGLDASGKGLFTISSAGGAYKLCYRAPGGSDSVEQNPDTGAISLQVIQATSTREDQVTSISPTVITSNVATTIAVIGAKSGDKASFVNSETSSCDQVTPEKDVGAGHASFTVSGAGTYVLCYTVKGASDSVQQKGISLTVKPPGVAQNMLGRWTSKNGNADCSGLSQVPYCSAAGVGECERSFTVMSGIGYKCFWHTGVWPPMCDVDMSTDERGMICQSNSCGGSPAMCW
ncbi:unnamed protein product [Effrenium voratum]|nr:unnamed protein product [Effrenium voratum]|eukprot:CAMPEP_0181462736 /NCGR_PEP_ID=MMETSP1110-20121109/34550_1 /TAXON_ID=174948 /ORGANISM="Symbiodinium sp., Strain CCMP421" /LENGTH=388 /DNA_ID=CAMNT_0023587407 /DNA_START=188 /DNA_END=1354 /DNA_ORIENTATION=-